MFLILTILKARKSYHFFSFFDTIVFIFFYFIFKLYNIVLVLPNIEMNLPQKDMVHIHNGVLLSH